MATGVLQQTTLRDQARSLIRTAVVTGEVAAGRIYPISYFAAKFGVSATPVREALLDLSNESLFEVVRNRGFRLTEVTERDISDVTEIRLMLEVPAMERVARQGLSVGQLARAQSEATEIVHRARAGDVRGFLDADRQFHLNLIATLGNQRLVQLVSQLRDQTRMHGLSALAATDRLTDSGQEHIDILNAVSIGDSAAARRLTTRHIEHVRGIWAGRQEPPIGDA